MEILKCNKIRVGRIHIEISCVLFYKFPQKFPFIRKTTLKQWAREGGQQVARVSQVRQVRKMRVVSGF